MWQLGGAGVILSLREAYISSPSLLLCLSKSLWWVGGGGWGFKPILVFSLSLDQAEQQQQLFLGCDSIEIKQVLVKDILTVFQAFLGYTLVTCINCGVQSIIISRKQEKKYFGLLSL